MLNYFQLLYDYFSLIYFTLHYLRLFMVIVNYFWRFSTISSCVTFGYSKLFLSILTYFTLSYFWLLKFFKAILCFFYYYKLFHFRLLVAIISYFWLL
jgi:hypothetical protein